MTASALPSSPTKTNSDGTGDDPALSIMTDLAGVIDKVGTIIDNLAWLHGTDGEKATARTNLGLGALATNSGSAIQNQSYVYFADSGTANNLVITPSPAISAYAAGMRFTVKVANDVAAGGAVINISGKGDIAIKRPDGNDPAAGQILANQIIEGVVYYTGSAYQFIVVSSLSGNLLPPDVQTAAGSETSLSFSIPSWASRITVSFNALSRSATDSLVLRLGDEDGVDDTGYISDRVRFTPSTNLEAAFTNGLHLNYAADTVGNAYTGTITLVKDAANNWTYNGFLATGGAPTLSGGGKTMPKVVTTLLLGTVIGTATLTGSVAVRVE